MERDYSSPDSVREEYEPDLRWDRAKRRHRILTTALILLAAALVGGAWYAYPLLKNHDLTLSQIPTTLTDVQKSVFSLGEQAKATDAKVDDWSTRQEELRGQLNRARGELMARVDSARKQASEASTALFERVRTPPPAAKVSVTQCLHAVRLDRNRRTPVLPKKRGSGQEKPGAQRPINAVSNGALTTLLRLVDESADQ